MATGTILVLDPTALPRDLRHPKAQRLDSLGGRKIGFLWNSKANGDILFNRLEDLLRQKYEISSTMHRQKPNASIPAEIQVYDELAKSVDAVVLGLGD
mgnify:CR=1 FL=1|tara:strand:+ start:2796 stop:3089 length:294 start_codon:yes stop_codon:yes gene_type:complete